MDLPQGIVLGNAVLTGFILLVTPKMGTRIGLIWGKGPKRNGYLELTWCLLWTNGWALSGTPYHFQLLKLTGDGQNAAQAQPGSPHSH